MQRTQLLERSHPRREFSCGKDLLDNYLKRQANQDVKRKLAACFVLLDHQSGLIKGYYTLSNNSIPAHSLPENFKKQLPPAYSSLPTTLLGRLAVDQRFKQQGIGKLLLIDALLRCLEISKSIGSFAVIVDPLDHDAKQFYQKYGFILLPTSGKMFLPIKTVEQLFS